MRGEQVHAARSETGRGKESRDITERHRGCTGDMDKEANGAVDVDVDDTQVAGEYPLACDNPSRAIRYAQNRDLRCLQ